MPKINVYLPDDLAAAVRDTQLPVSAICQAALERAVRDIEAARSTDEPPTGDRGRGGLFRHFTDRAQRGVGGATRGQGTLPLLHRHRAHPARDPGTRVPTSGSRSWSRWTSNPVTCGTSWLRPSCLRATHLARSHLLPLGQGRARPRRYRIDQSRSQLHRLRAPSIRPRRRRRWPGQPGTTPDGCRGAGNPSGNHSNLVWVRSGPGASYPAPSCAARRRHR